MVQHNGVGEGGLSARSHLLRFPLTQPRWLNHLVALSPQAGRGHSNDAPEASDPPIAIAQAHVRVLDCAGSARLKEIVMNPYVVPVGAIVAGILVLFMPRLLNYIVALALIAYGLYELNKVHHFLPSDGDRLPTPASGQRLS